MDNLVSLAIIFVVVLVVALIGFRNLSERDNCNERGGAYISRQCIVGDFQIIQ